MSKKQYKSSPSSLPASCCSMRGINNLLNNLISFPINIDQFGHIPTFFHNKFNFLFLGCPQYMAIICIDDTFDWLIIAITCIICAWRYYVWLFITGLLSGSWWLYTMKVLLVKTTILAYAMFPFLWLFVF